MSHRLFWKLCFIIATGAVSLFYGVDLAVEKARESMSSLSDFDKQTLTQWANHAEGLYQRGDHQALNHWLETLGDNEKTWVAVAKADIQPVAGDSMDKTYHKGYNLGRSIDWEIHLFFKDNPIMEIPFKKSDVSFLIQLPNRMRPGDYWETTRMMIQVIFPLIILCLVSYILYRHIMAPLRTLQDVTKQFTQGNFDVRAHDQIGERDDEIAELVETFDIMAARIGELILSQRQLIADLSHELRTPLARLDITLDSIESNVDGSANVKVEQAQIERLQRESRQIRKLVEDALTFAWLDNERPVLDDENIDLIDLLDVLIEDASYEFPDRKLTVELPNSAPLCKSNHKALGQAIENILRNALRYTSKGQQVSMRLAQDANDYQLVIQDQGPGVPEDLLDKIFEPFYRIEKSRQATQHNFGLGLALARRQIQAVGGKVKAKNIAQAGLQMTITLPKNTSA